MKKDRGIAIVTVALFMAVILPVFITFTQLSIQTIKNVQSEKRQKSASELANNAIMDFMRQFSQSYYEDHYSVDNLARNEAFYNVGFSSVSFITDSVNHTLYIQAKGKYGQSASNPLAQKTLDALIQFFSDMVRFGTMINSSFGISASNVTYDGGVWINGNLSITGSNVRFNGGPLIVNGNISGGTGGVVDGDLYYSGTSAGNLTVNGTRYNFIPQLQWPRLDFTYYNAHYNYKTTVARTIVFNSNGTFTIVGGPTITIPATGAIIYGENCNLTIRGTVAGRVTVVAGGCIGCWNQGNITVNGDLIYASGTSATAQNSMSVLARNTISFIRYGGNLTVCGVFFTETSNFRVWGNTNFQFRLNGTRSSGITLYNNAFAAGRFITYDPNLQIFPPPGLPEKPMLVNWNIR